MGADTSLVTGWLLMIVNLSYDKVSDPDQIIYFQKLDEVELAN